MLATRKTLLQSILCSRGAATAAVGAPVLSSIATCRTMHSSSSSNNKPSSPTLVYSKSATSFSRLSSNNRHFSLSAPLSKKGGKAAREASRSEATTPSSSKSKSSTTAAAEAGAAEDAEDFTVLESEISKCIERLRTDLSKLRAGGRFNPEVLEALRVQVSSNNSNSTSSNSGGKSEKTSVKLGDLAQVVPKGRTVVVIVGEAEHLKPISSAIQASSLSLTPQPDPTGANPLALHIPIPPPTADSRKAAVQAATKAGETATTGVRNARAGQQKKLRAAQVNKTIRPDDLKKAGVAMEKVVEKGLSEVKKVVDGAKKALDV